MESLAGDPQEFLARLSQSGVLPADKLNALTSKWQSGELGRSAEALAADLVRLSVLTSFQAEQVLKCQSPVLVVGRYVLEDKLGEGGMGIVYRALHKEMHRHVALKLLSPEAHRFREAQQRFRREVQILAKLNHPNIVTAYDAGEAGGVHYLAMEYVDGSDLRRTVQKDGAMPVREAVDCIVQAAQGLGFAHSHQIVHRDVKPSNLLRSAAGVVRVLDLGLACPSLPDDSSLSGITTTDTVMGTVDFMAPEQSVSTREADHRSDIYSLGMTLYYLLTGRVAYSGDSAIARVIAHRESPIPDLSGCVPAVPSKLNDVFRRMVAKQPADRQQSMGEVVADLCAIQEFPAPLGRTREDSKTIAEAERGAGFPRRSSSPMGRDPESTTMASTIVLPSSWKRRRRRVLSWVGVLALTAGVIGGALIGHGWVAPPPGPLPDPSDGRPLESTTTRTAVPSPLKAAAAGGMPIENAHPDQAAFAREWNVEPVWVTSTGLKMMLIPPGESVIGSTGKEARALADGAQDPETAQMHLSELPETKARISKPFYCGVFEVTQRQYRDVIGGNPSEFTASNEHPVETVSWEEAVEFCNTLSKLEKLPPYYAVTGEIVAVRGGTGYRLPTDEEWEYACRAHAAWDFDVGGRAGPVDRCAWHIANSGRSTNPAGRTLPNGFGLFDMHGNVWEWCEGVYASGHDFPDADQGRSLTPRRIIRGGSWSNAPEVSRAAGRYRYPQNTRGRNLGFRIVKTIAVAERAGPADR